MFSHFRPTPSRKTKRYTCIKHGYLYSIIPPKKRMRTPPYYKRFVLRLLPLSTVFGLSILAPSPFSFSVSYYCLASPAPLPYAGSTFLLSILLAVHLFLIFYTFPTIFPSSAVSSPCVVSPSCVVSNPCAIRHNR